MVFTIITIIIPPSSDLTTRVIVPSQWHAGDGP